MKIVVSVVNSPAGERALALARQEATDHGADLVLVSSAVVGPGTADEVAAIRARLDELESELSAAGLGVSSEWSVGPSMSEPVIDAARKHAASMIVMGLRRRSAVGKALTGSFEQEVLLGAPCPVLTVLSPLG